MVDLQKKKKNPQYSQSQSRNKGSFFEKVCTACLGDDSKRHESIKAW